MADSIFTKIINSELPSHKVYEDSHTIAIIPLHPIAKAHVLVIPKRQVDEFFKLPDDDYQSLMKTVKMVAERLQQVIQPKRVGLQAVGLDVPHAHIHVIAFDTLDEYRELPDTSQEPDHQALAEMAEKLAF